MKRSAEHGSGSLWRSAENGFESFCRSTEHGFTLVEMMVALVIFGLLAAAGVSLLTFGVRAQGAAFAGLDDVAATRRLSVVLAGDLAQTLPRIARDVDGRPVRAFTGNDGRSDPLVMGYVRGGRTNPDNVARAGVERVDILFDGSRLLRATYPAVDGTVAAPGTVLSEGVTAITMRYRDRSGVWRARWDNAALESIPAAVEMTVARRGHAPLTFAWLGGPA